MERKPATQTSHLNLLPPELIHTILCKLDSFSTLRCAVLSCRLFYDVFYGSPSAIATQVVVRELDLCDVRPEAIAALQSSKLGCLTRLSLLEFCKDHFQERNTTSSIHLTLDEALGVSKLHATVSRLAEDFSNITLKELGAAGKPSMLEKGRILRALYITEVFFNLFRQNSIPDAEIQGCMNDFFLNFTLWELDQIFCIHDFLFFKVYPTFNNMAAHDVAWGNFEVVPIEWFGQPELQSILFKGLVTLESIANAKTYIRQHELFDCGQIPTARPYNLYRALEEFHLDIPLNVDASPSNFESSQDYALKLRRPFFEDPDDGPFIIWKWVSKSERLGRYANLENEAAWRGVGYVMWDRARLDALGIMRDEWQPRAVRGYLVDVPVEEIDEEGWISSWQERSRIYGEGGSGWWGFGDESKIVWATKKELGSL